MDTVILWQAVFLLWACLPLGRVQKVELGACSRFPGVVAESSDAASGEEPVNV